MMLALFSVLLINNFVSSRNINQTITIPNTCVELNILNGNVSTISEDGTLVHIVCSPNHDIVGSATLHCLYGRWNSTFVPICVARCKAPPYIWNGGIQIEGEKARNGMFKRDTLVTYTCSPGYYLLPTESKYRVCKDGAWSGVDAYCELVGCKQPDPIKNGYFVRENLAIDGDFGIGERLHYSCNNGYILTGTSTQKCLSDGNWSPKIPPKCVDSIIFRNCPTLPNVPHSVTKLVSGFQLENPLSGTEIEINCVSKYHNIKAPCRPSRMKCIAGEWIGALPMCVYTTECPPPPEVRHANRFDVETAVRYDSNIQRYLANTQFSYQCSPGYEIRGNEILTCSSGCWVPAELPVCRTLEQTYIDANTGSQVVISMLTGTGVLLLLVVTCLVIICRRRKPLSRAVSIQPTPPRIDLADHAALLHHPDRLALIAFADGMQPGQPVLPTYEEATRDRGPGCPTTRIARPHWPSVAARRARNSPNPDSIHVTRQGSFASHSASIRSDPMGSTDTMAVSENSTTVTLDTASSHSSSQAASCRAHCGSLASFDTSSILNTEGVPLLEENELEEIQCGDDVSLAMENRSMTDNISIKLSTASDVA